MILGILLDPRDLLKDPIPLIQIPYRLSYQLSILNDVLYQFMVSV